MAERLTLDAYADGVVAGDRAVLARAITLVESRRADDAAVARALIERLLPRTGNAVRVGITGVPGVGKSSFIEALGTRLTTAGKHVAVLAVDPSSTVTGGSILGDKTRMATLSRDPNAFIRPSPGGGTLGGVARRTREALLLCEAAGFDVVLIETIGVGQSEIAVANMVDVFLLLALAGAGDELQGIKKGITELAEVVAITKADGDNAKHAAGARAQFALALALIDGASGRVAPPVLTCSSLTGDGLDEVWDAVLARRADMEADGSLEEKRRHQALHWMEDTLGDLLRERLEGHPGVAAALPDVRAAVLAGTLDPVTAAGDLIALLDQA